MLDINDLSFSYKDRKILENIVLNGRNDRVISILGPNGVGKTTLLKCMCNILKPEAGVVMVSGTDISGYSGRELAKQMSYVPQRSQATRVLVFDAVLIGRRPHMEWSAGKKDLDITWDAIRVMGLEDLALRYVDEISGGEFQKVIIARAIVQEPKVLILHEPTNNLDVSNHHLTLHLIADTVRHRQICTIMTMHDINLATHYSDELIFMKDGHIMKHGGLEIIDRELIKEVYGLEADIIQHEGIPFVIPKKMHHKPVELMHSHPHD